VSASLCRRYSKCLRSMQSRLIPDWLETAILSDRFPAEHRPRFPFCILLRISAPQEVRKGKIERRSRFALVSRALFERLNYQPDRYSAASHAGACLPSWCLLKVNGRVCDHPQSLGNHRAANCRWFARRLRLLFELGKIRRRKFHATLFSLATGIGIRSVA